MSKEVRFGDLKPGSAFKIRHNEYFIKIQYDKDKLKKCPYGSPWGAIWLLDDDFPGMICHFRDDDLVTPVSILIEEK